MAAGLLWGVDGLAAGGLAPLLVAVVVGALLGAPLAARLWELADREDERVEALRVSANVCATLVAAGVMARVVEDTAAGTALGLGLLVLAGLAPRLRRGMAVILVLTGVIAALAQAPAVPWTLLRPGWGAWQRWLPMAFGTGLLLSGAGFGAWSAGSAAVPGYRRGPWLTVGLGGLVLTGTAVVWAQAFEASDGVMGQVSGPLPWLMALAAASGWGDREEWPDSGHFLGLGLAFVWLNSALAPEAAIFWPLLLWLPSALGGVLLAYETRGAERLTALLPGGLGLAVLVWAWPGFGPDALAAVAAVVPVLAVLWTGGTRLAVGRG